MLDAAATAGGADQTTADELPASSSKEPAMQIGEEQQEFEVLPTEEAEPPLVLPEGEPRPQPAAAPA